jgi:hypothetical protein
MHLSIKLSLATSLVAIAVGACGSEPESTFNDKDKAGTDQNNGGRLGGGNDGTIGGGNGDAPPGTPDDFKQCATKTAAADQKPVYLVFMFDKSGSMVSNGSPKWSSAKAASKSFFESPDSKNVHASLTFFPDQADYSCDSNDYSAPSVAMTSLPNASLGASMDQQAPDGGTPTYVALQGAIKYAQTVAEGEGKDGNVAVVLVTDGIPDSDCSGNSIPDVKSLAASVAGALPTYVIGVGNQLSSLKEIAVGGGTKSALIINTTNPQQIQADFLKAVNTIKASAMACDYEIPAPPSGEQLDRSKVNVIYKSEGAAETIPYSQACAAGTGWRYDDANSPKRILLCEGTCSNVKTKAGQMEVLFGCETKGGGVK